METRYYRAVWRGPAGASLTGRNIQPGQRGRARRATPEEMAVSGREWRFRPDGWEDIYLCRREDLEIEEG